MMKLKQPDTLKMVEELFAKDASERIKDKVKLERYLPPQPLAPQRTHVEFKETEQAHLFWAGQR